jgi:ferredoxin-fold anticodon binding domain-containing protein
MSLDNLTFGEIKQIAKMFNNSEIKNENPMIGKYCVIRTYSAGVHIGIVESINGTEVLLKNARRIWRWSGAFTLSEVSLGGLDAKESRISDTVKEIFLTQAIEIIPATEKAIKSFEACNE